MKEHPHKDEQTSGATGPSHVGETVSVSKRRLLRGAASSVPVIMTMQSGAAMAAASSLLAETGLSQDPQDFASAPAMMGGDLVCMDGTMPGEPVTGGPSGTKYEEPFNGCLVPDDTYTDSNNNTPLSAMDVCTGNINEVYTGSAANNPPKYAGQGGLLVSATAFSSISPTFFPCDKLL